jgi:hypothetical protein
MNKLQSIMTASEQEPAQSFEEWYDEGQKELDRGHDIRGLSRRKAPDRGFYKGSTVALTEIHSTACFEKLS